MKNLWLIGIAFGAAVSGAAQQPAPTPGNTLLVTISFNTAVLQTTEAQADLAALQTKYGPRKTRLETMAAEIEDLRKQSATDPTKATILSGKEKQLQREAEDFQTETQAASEQTFQKVAQKMYTFLQQYASQHSYTAVIERGSDATPVVWYVARNVDITKAVIDAYNAQLPTAPSTPAAPKPTAGTTHSH